MPSFEVKSWEDNQAFLSCLSIYDQLSYSVSLVIFSTGYFRIVTKKIFRRSLVKRY